MKSENEERADVQAPVLFTAAIDLTLNILVQGIPDSERILLLKPRTVLISELPCMSG
jgi:hypothetical protein